MIGTLTFEGTGNNHVATVAEIRGLKFMHLGNQRVTINLGALEDIVALLDGVDLKNVKIELHGR
jgi:hypothetical protein